MNTIYALGHDFGNSETCLVLHYANGFVERRIPSVTAPGSWKLLENTAAGMGKSVQETLASNHYVLEYDSPQPSGVQHIEKYVGHKAFESPHLSETRGDLERYWKNRHSLELLMVGSASMVSPAEYGLHLVTGLPITTYSQEHASLVEQALTGSHLFWLNGEQRIMHVLSVKVIMEGAGALIAYGSPHDLQGVVDIGGQTTDLFFAQGQKPIADFCRGKALGVAAAADRVQLRFREEYGSALSPEKCRSLLYQHVHRMPYEQTRSRKGLVSDIALGTLIESALSEIGQDIATFVVAAWGEKLLDLDRILLVGGGAHYFASHIQERIEHATQTPKPEMANATGYAGLAALILKRASSQMRAS